jgi:site-specific DNA-methyltransferase (adenine-specific)
MTGKKGWRYKELIDQSDLSEDEKANAMNAIFQVRHELAEGKITDFRMKIRGMHKKAFGGQAGGRNNQIDKHGFTVIRMFGNKLKRDVIESSVANTKNIDHPAVFPLTLVTEVIKLLSEKGNVILDPFCGSGQVCVAAKSLDRQYLGIDLSPYYCEMARKRL